MLLHEILLSLLGNTGSLIVEKNGAFIINPGVTFLTEAEKQMISQICNLGCFYKHISEFIQKYGGLNSQFALQLAIENVDTWEDTGFEMIGVYVKAFCRGTEEVLALFRQHVLLIEHEYLMERTLSVISLQHKLSIFYMLFPVLYEIIVQIQEQNLKGGQLLDVLYEYSLNGNPAVRQMCERILNHCHRVFYQQLNAWIVHGQLIDFCDEFFIHRIDRYEENMKTSPSKGKDDSIIGQSSTSNVTQTYFSSSLLKRDLKEEIQEWNSIFTLRLSMLPINYIPAALAEKILFIGKAVRVLQSRNARKEDRIPLEELEAYSTAMMKLQNMEKFDINLFTKVIEHIRECVASRLWQLVMIKADLLLHIKYMRNFFLLAKGEFYQTFIEEARKILSLPPTSASEHEINYGPFKQTLSKLNIEDDPYIKNFKLKIRSYGFQFANFGSLADLSVVGNAVIYRKTMIRFQTTKHSKISGAIWHSLKQKVDGGFKTWFSFKMKSGVDAGPGGDTRNHEMSIGYSSPRTPSSPRTSRLSTNIQMQEVSTPRIMRHYTSINPINTTMSMIGESDERQQMSGVSNPQGPMSVTFALVLQNEKEVIPWKKVAPLSTKDLNEYIAIKFTTRIIPQQQQQNTLRNTINPFKFSHTISGVSVWTSTANNTGKMKSYLSSNPTSGEASSKNEVKIADVDLEDEIDFLDMENHNVIIDYDRDVLKVYIDKTEGTSIVRLDLKLNDVIKLDNGTCYMGFVQESSNVACSSYLINWNMISSNSSTQNKDGWGGLSIEYKTQWPLHLIFSSDIIEKYNSIFRSLFPIRRIQLELQQVWGTELRKSTHPRARQLFQERSNMSFLIDNFLSYLQVDVLESQWSKLSKALESCTDFEELRKYHDRFLLDINKQSFFNMGKVQRALQECVHICGMFCKFVRRLGDDLYESWNEKAEKEFFDIKQEFEKQSAFMFKILSTFKKHENSPHLAQLLPRIDYNKYFSDIVEHKDIVFGGERSSLMP